MAGNVFSTGGAGPGIIRITSPEGRLLGTINLPIYGGEPRGRSVQQTSHSAVRMARTLFMAGCDSVTIRTRGAWDRAGAQREQAGALEQFR